MIISLFQTLEEVTSSETKVPNVSMSWPDFYHRIMYKIGKDFNITLKLNGNRKNNTVHLNSLYITKETENMISLEEMYTIWTGMCYKITRKGKIYFKCLYT